MNQKGQRNRYKDYQSKGDSLGRKASTHQLQQDVGFLPLTFFYSWSHLWTVEAKGAGWWSAPVQSMLGNCQDYNAPLLAGLAAMPRAEWATETELVMTTAGSPRMTRGPPHPIARPPWNDILADLFHSIKQIIFSLWLQFLSAMEIETTSNIKRRGKHYS